MKRKELIDRVNTLEYVLSNVITNARSLELVIDYYIEMNKDVKTSNINSMKDLTK